jgi:hypothetical protein
MLDVTKPALNRLSHRLTLKRAAADIALRITRREGAWRLRFDRQRPGDTAIANDGRNVLLMEETVTQATADMKLCVRATETGPRLRLRRRAIRNK